MSTRCSMVYAEGVHLFTDLADGEVGEAFAPAVYLELSGEGVDFEAGPDRVQVRIPATIWEAIRRTPLVPFDKLCRDDELRAEAEAAASRMVGRSGSVISEFFAHMDMLNLGLDPDKATAEEVAAALFAKAQYRRVAALNLAEAVRRTLGLPTGTPLPEASESLPATDGKYGVVTATNKQFHPGEPVWLFRATDPLAPAAIHAYGDSCFARSCSPEHVAAAHEVAFRMKAWQEANPGLVKKLPD